MNFSRLANITPLDLNLSERINSDNLVPSLIDGANETTGGYFGLGVMLIIFLAFTVIMYKQDGDIALDIMRSMFISSGFATIMGVILLVSNISTSLRHVLWFLTLFVLLYFMIREIKKKGL